MTRQQWTQQMRSRRTITIGAAIAGGLLLTTLALGQRSENPSRAARDSRVSTQPDGTGRPPPPHLAGRAGAGATQPSEISRARRAAERAQSTTRPAGRGPRGVTPGGPNGAEMHPDADQRREQEEAALERQAAAARASVNRRSEQPRPQDPGNPAGVPHAVPTTPGGNVVAPMPPGRTPPVNPAINPVPTGPRAMPNAGGPRAQHGPGQPGMPVAGAPGTPTAVPAVSGPTAVAPGATGQPAVSMNPATGLPQVKPKDFWWMPPQDRPYFFTWNNTPFEKACHDLEEMSGLNMLNMSSIDPATKTKTISFQSNSLLTYDDALTLFDTIAFDMNYWVVHRKPYLVIRQLTEWYRYIPPERIFANLEEYRKAELPRWEIASVMYQPKVLGASVLANRAVDVIPINGARATVVPGTNMIELKGFVYFLEQQLDQLVKIDDPSFKDDKRVVKTYMLQYATAADAARLLQAIMPSPADVGSQNPTMPRQPNRPGMPPQPGAPEATGSSTADQIDIQEDQRLNRLVVKATENNHKIVAEYLKQYIDLPMDEGVSRPELIVLKHADPTEVVDTIKPLIGERQFTPVQQQLNRPQTPPPNPNIPQPQIIQVMPNSSAIMVPVPASKSILVKANRDEMSFIKNYIRMLDVEGPEAKVQYIPLKFGQGNSVANILNSSLGQRQNPGRMTPGQPQAFHAVADQQNDRGVVISGEPKDIIEAKDLITKLDVDPDQGAIDQLVQLEHASATALADLLNTRYSVGGGRGGRYGGGGGSSLPKFIGDEMSKTLVVVCTKEMWTDIERVIKDVDDRSVIKGSPRSYALKHSNASTIASILSQSFGMRQNNRYGQDTSAPNFQADPQSNRILVTATEEIHEQVSKLVQDLDQPSPSENATLQAIELANADAAYVASKIEDLFQPSARGGGYGPSIKVPVNVVAEPVSNRVLVSASPEDFKKAEDLAKNIDQQFKARQIVRKTFRPEHMSSFKIEKALQTLFPEASSGMRGYGRGAGTEESPTTVKIVDTGDSIAVCAPADKMKEIERVIHELDSNPTDENEIKTYTVKAVDAEGTYGIAQNLEELFNGARGPAYGQGATPKQIKFIGQRGSNLLFVSAPPDRMKEVEGRVQEILKSQEAKDMTFAIRHFEVKQATPEDLANMITPLLTARFEELENQSGGRRNIPDPQIVPQRAVRRVTVAAPEAMMAFVEELIKQFDQPTTASTMRIVSLRTAKAVDLAPTIEANIEKQEGSSGSSRSRRYRSSHSYSPGGYTPGYSSGSSLSGSRRSDSSESLQVTAVESSNSLILRGPEDLVFAAQKLAIELDSTARPETIIKTYTLMEGVDPYEMVTLIEDLVGSGSSDDDRPVIRRVSAGPGGAPIMVKTAIGNRIIVSAPAEKLPIIEQLIKTQEEMVAEAKINGDSAGGRGTVMGTTSRGELTKGYEVVGSVDDVAKNLDKILVSIFGYFDAPYVKSLALARQVIVTGKPQQFKVVEEWLDKLQKNPPPPTLAVFVKRVPTGTAGRIVAALAANSVGIPVNAQALPVAHRERQSPMEQIQSREIFTDTPITTQPAAAHFVPPSAALSSLRKAIASIAIAQAVVTTQPAAAQATQPAVAATATRPASAPPVRVPQTVAQPVSSASVGTTASIRTSAAPVPAAVKPPAAGVPAAGVTEAAQGVNPVATAAAEAALGGKVQIRYDEEQGVIYVVGPVGELDQLQKTIDELIDQAQQLVSTGEEQPIRVFRLEHVDVTIAASVLEAMFNEKAATVPGVGRPGQPAAAPQAPVQPKPPTANSSDSKKDDKTSSSRRRRGEDREEDEETEKEAAKKKQAGERIRVVPNTRDQSLIIRADRDDFPLIVELLLKIDRPAERPPVDFRVFAIKKLNAFDVEQVLKSLLKIEDTNRMGMGMGMGYGGMGGAYGGGLSRSGFSNYAAQAQMMEQLQQQMLEMQTAGMEGADGEGKFKLNPAKEITITSDATTNSVVVMAPSEGMKLVEKLINTLEEQESPVQIVTIKIKNAEADKIAAQLERVFAGTGRTSTAGSTGSTRRTGSRSSGGFSNPFSGSSGGLTGGSSSSRIGQEMRITSDSRTNMVVIRALASDIPRIKEIIELMDVPMVEQVQLYPVEHGNATEMAKTLSDIFAADPKAEGPQATRITADADTNTLLVWAPKAQQTMIKTKIDELESRAGGNLKPREIQLAVANATSVADKLRDIFVPKGVSSKGVRQRITIQGDDNSQTLFVTAPKEVFEEISEIAKRLDTVNRQDIKVFPLKNAYASDVHTMFAQMVAQQIQLSGKGASEGMPSVVPDPRTNSLIVTGTPVVFMAVEKVLAQIDVAPTDKSLPTTAMFPLTKGTAANIAASINALFAGRIFQNGVKPPTAVPEPSSNVVYVYGTKSQIDEVRTQLIDPLEKYTPTLDTVVQDYQIPVKYAKVEELAEVLVKMFQAKQMALNVSGYASTPPADRAVSITADPSTRQLLITCSEKNKKLIDGLIAKADIPTASEGARKNRVFPLQYAIPAYAVQAIATTIGKPGNVSEVEKVNVVAEPGTNSIVVSASDENMKKVEAMLLDLDKPGTAARVTVPVEITNADANDVAAALNDIYTNTRDRTSTGRLPALFTVPRGTNQVLVTSTESELPRIKTLIQQLDVPGSRMTPKIIPVKHGLSAVLASTLTRMFAEQPRARKTNDIPPLIMSDDNTNSLVVKATEADYNLIAEMAVKLDTDATDTVVQDYQVPVKYAKVEDLAVTLLKMFQSKQAALTGAQYASTPPADRAVSITADPATRQLLITCSPKNKKLIDLLIATADTPAASEGARKSRVFPLQYAIPGYAAQAITTTLAKQGNVSEVEKVTVVAEPGTNSLVVSASDENMKKVEAMLLDLDKPGTAARVTVPVEIGHADANDVATALNDIYANQRDRTNTGRLPALFTVPRGTNQVLVTSTEAELPRIKTLIQQLDVPGSRTTPKIIPVKYGSSAVLAATLTRMFTEQPRTRKTNEIPPLIMSDENTNSLVVKATEVDYNLIAEMALKLDTVATAATSVEVISVGRGMDLRTFAQQIESTINNGAAFASQQTGVKAGRVAIGIDDRGPSLIVAGSPELFRTVRELVNKLEGARPRFSSQPRTTMVIPTGPGLGGADLKKILEQWVSESRKNAAAAQTEGVPTLPVSTK